MRAGRARPAPSTPAASIAGARRTAPFCPEGRLARSAVWAWAAALDRPDEVVGRAIPEAEAVGMDPALGLHSVAFDECLGNLQQTL